MEGGGGTSRGLGLFEMIWSYPTHSIEGANIIQFTFKNMRIEIGQIWCGFKWGEKMIQQLKFGKSLVRNRDKN